MSHTGWGVVCPNYGHLHLTSSFTTYIFVKNIFATMVSVLKLFQLSNGDFRSMPTYSIYKVRKPRMTKLEQGVEVRAHYPIYLLDFTVLTCTSSAGGAEGEWEEVSSSSCSASSSFVSSSLFSLSPSSSLSLPDR